MSNLLALSPRNAGPWLAIADFLDAQYLASFGLRRVARAGQAAGELASTLPAAQSAYPVGNTGTTSQNPLLPLGAVTPAFSLGLNHG